MFVLGCLSFLAVLTWVPPAFAHKPRLELPYKIIFDNVSRCEIDADEDQLQLTYGLDEDRTWTTNWTWPFDVDNSIKLIETEWWYGPQGWEEVEPPLTTDDFCTIIKEDYRDFFEPFLEHMGAPVRCPIPAGTYLVGNFGIDPFALSSFPMYEFGEYYADLDFFKEDISSGSNERFGCVRLHYTVVPESALQSNQ